MQVKIEYTSKIKIDEVSIPLYITEENQVFIGLEIMPYIELKQQIKQLVITDIEDLQYNVYPFIEVCKFIKKNVLIKLNTENIKTKEHKEIEKKESSEFVLTIKNIVKSKK